MKNQSKGRYRTFQLRREEAAKEIFTEHAAQRELQRSRVVEEQEAKREAMRQKEESRIERIVAKNKADMESGRNEATLLWLTCITSLEVARQWIHNSSFRRNRWRFVFVIVRIQGFLRHCAAHFKIYTSMAAGGGVGATN